MFCRNCGKEMDNNAAVCVSCGVKKGVGEKYCPNCGKETLKEAEFCTGCGYAFEQGPVEPTKIINNNGTTVDVNPKSKIVAGILGILLGSLGIHNFYLGFTGKAIAQLLISVLSCGALAVVSGIWGLVEGIMILTSNEYFDAQGNKLKD